MTRIFKRAAALATCATLCLSACYTNDTSSAKPNPYPDPTMMFSWDQSQKLVGFSHTADIYGTESFVHGSNVYPLPYASPNTESLISYQYGLNTDGSAVTNNTIRDYMYHNKITGLLIIKNGQIVTERYAGGIDSSSLWDSKSVGKSVVSTLLGIAMKEGYISSLNDTVEHYIPELVGSAYEGVTLRNMLSMASGVAWNENYTDPASDIVTLHNCSSPSAATNSDVCVINFMKTLPKAINTNTTLPAVQGAVWNYSSGEAYLVGLAVQRATGQSLGQYLQQKIWQPFGMEADGNWLTGNGKVSMGWGGFNATLRDYGRFGLFVLNNGVLANGTKILPDTWVSDATTWTSASASPGYAENGQYGLFWWFSPAWDNGLQPSPLYVNLGAPLQNTDLLGGAVPVQGRPPVPNGPGSVSDWTFEAIGIYGQMIAINQLENLVVVEWGVWDKPDPIFDPTSPEYVANDPYTEQAVFLNAVVQALH